MVRFHHVDVTQPQPPSFMWRPACWNQGLVIKQELYHLGHTFFCPFLYWKPDLFTLEDQRAVHRAEHTLTPMNACETTLSPLTSSSEPSRLGHSSMHEALTWLSDEITWALGGDNRHIRRWENVTFTIVRPLWRRGSAPNWPVNLWEDSFPNEHDYYMNHLNCLRDRPTRTVTPRNGHND